MFEVIYMKADYEPWWMFEGWEEMVKMRQIYENEDAAKAHLLRLVEELRGKYKHEAMKKEHFYAFWSESEKIFCEGCDEDLQLFHGVFILSHKK